MDHNNSHEVKVEEASFEEDVKHTISTADTKRISGHSSGTWSGVQGCCDDDRVQLEARKLKKEWLDRELLNYPGYYIVRSGWEATTAECRSWERPTQGRGCNGSMSLPCFAIIAKN